MRCPVKCTDYYLFRLRYSLKKGFQIIEVVSTFVEPLAVQNLQASGIKEPKLSVFESKKMLVLKEAARN